LLLAHLVARKDGVYIHRVICVHGQDLACLSGALRSRRS
jgi:hypothetical protein